MPISKRRRLADFSNLVLGTDKAMRIRTSQFLSATVLMLGCIGVMHVVQSNGHIEMPGLSLWALCSIGGLIVFYSLIRSGASQRLRDPSLAVWQMLFAIGCNAVAFIIAGHARGITLPILAVILMFGMFGMSMQQVAFIALYGLLCFGLSALYVTRYTNPVESPELMLSYVLIVVVVLSATTFLTWRLRQMSDRIRHQRTELEKALEKIKDIAVRDELTGAYNRRFMLEKMREETSRADRDSQSLLFVILDVDHFKAVNDSLGHQAGDLALQALVQVCQKNIRNHDALGRWGGEEFLILLTQTNAALGLASVERIRAQVASTPVEIFTSTLTLTVSIGVTAYLPGEDIEKTLARADQALYAAKGQGRNQTVWA
jgi:diguanylate cyclase (GGDEF)-like protein